MPLDTRRRRPVDAHSEWILSIDLGQTIDPTALSVVEKRTEGNGIWTMTPDKVETEQARERLQLLDLERIPLRTPYPRIIMHAADLLAGPPFDGRGHLVIDQTGVGRPIVDLFRDGGLKPIGITMTGGVETTKPEPNEFHVPKSTLVSALEAALSSGDLEIAPDIEDMDNFKSEVTSMRRRISNAGHVSFAARAGQHDDEVLSVAMAVWWATHMPKPPRVVQIAGF